VKFPLSDKDADSYHVISLCLEYPVMYNFLIEGDWILVDRSGQQTEIREESGGDPHQSNYSTTSH
jgi:hypothetical protein